VSPIKRPGPPEHESLYGRARDGVAVLAQRDWRIHYANASLLEILGLIGRPEATNTLWEALPDWADTEEAAHLRRAMEERTRVTFRVGRERGGGWVWEVTADPLPNGDLRVRLHNATAAAEMEEIDALERAARERESSALTRERAALFRMLDTLPVGVVVAEAPSGRIIYINPAAAEAAGRPAAVLEAADPSEYSDRWRTFLPTGEPFPPEDLPLVAALRGEVVREVEVIFRPTEGDERTVLVSGVPLLDAEGKVERGMVAFYDITDRLALERELVERTADAEHAAANAAMRAEESRALREMGRALVSTLEPRNALRLAAQNAMELLGARGSFVATPGTAGVDMRLAPALGIMEPLDGVQAPLAGSVTARVLEEGTQLLNSVDLLPESSPLRDPLIRAGVRNLLLVPMRAFGEALGVLGVVDRSGGFGPEDARLLEAFGDSAALAIHNARLYAGERRRNVVNRALLGAAEVLTSTLDPDEVQERIVILAEELVGADGAGLSLLVGEEREEVWMAVASGLLEPTRGVRTAAAGSLTEAALQRGTPEVFSTGGENGPTVRGLRALGVESYALCPLLVGEERLGVLALVRGPEAPAFAPEEVQVLAMLGSQAALAVRNARLYRQAQAASRAKSDFLAMMSHELRTPLNAVEGYASLLGDEIYGPVNEAQQTAIRRMRAAQTHLVELIDQVLDVAQVEAGTRRVNRAPVPLARLADEVAETLRGAAEAAGLAMEVEVEEVGEVRTDAGMVRQILVNLVGNALKFSERGGISVRLQRDGGEVLVEVADSGPGIPPELRERIFEPFFQADATPTRRAGGVGLGLALSREFARLLGGDLSVASTLGEGSTFTLRLPAGTPAG
jgi:signal transduction histidine kinase/PAS domain-containing protein